MNSDGCGFCRRGREVNDVCGKLYHTKTNDNGPVAAHRKCMQYSANLSQYTYSHFGGFDVGEVFEEYKRGCKLRCHLCWDTKKAKKNKKAHGATAGCAVQKCPHSFHYYCASKNKTTITKKLRKSHGKKDNYMTFCCSKHENNFRAKKQDYSSCEESSESENGESGHSEQCSVNTSDSEVGNDTRGNVNDVDDDIYRALASGSSADGEDVETGDNDDITFGTVETVKNPRDLNNAFICTQHTESENEDHEANSSDSSYISQEGNRQHGDTVTSSDSDEEVTTSKKYKRIIANRSISPGKRRSGVHPHSSSGSPGKKWHNGHSSPDNKRSDVYSYNCGATATPKRRLAEESTDEGHRSCQSTPRKKKSDAARCRPPRTVSPRKILTTRSRSKGRHEEGESTLVRNRLPACAVCISEGPVHSSKSVRRLQDAICQQYDIPTQHVFIWQRLEHSTYLPQYNTLAFLKDLVQRVLDNDVPEVDRLLFDRKYLKEIDMAKYQTQAAFLKDLGESLEKQVWSQLESHRKVSDSVGGVTEVDDKRNLILLLNDTGIDSEGKLREKLGVTEESFMFTWAPDTVVINRTGDEDVEFCPLERDTIIAWIEENIPVVSHVYVHPTEQTLKTVLDGVSVTDEIATHFQGVKTGGRHTVLVFKQVDEKVLNFQPYCRKAIQKVLPFCVRTRNELTVIMDTRSLGIMDIHQQLRSIFRDDEGNQLPITIRSAFDPSSVSLSCVMVEVI